MTRIRNIKKWHMAGIFFTLVLGSLSHFFYNWSGGSPLIAPFFPVNESTWEHLKLLVSPMILFSCVEYFVYGKKLLDFLPVRILSLFSGITVIVSVFYTYTAIAGQHWLWADIGIFILAVVVAYLLSYLLFLKKPAPFAEASITSIIAGIFIALLLVCFIVFTTDPPHIFLFCDPVTGGYGISQPST